MTKSCGIIGYAQIHIALAPGRKGNLMNNNEKFNALLNSCAHSRLIYSVLMDFAKPSLQQTDDVSKKRQIIVREMLAFFNKAKGKQ